MKLSFSTKKDCMNEYFARDAKIELPKDGIPLRFGEETIQHLRPGDVEIAYTEDGVVMYVSLTLVGYERLRRILELNTDNW